jgi:hypothetical protein
MNSPSPGIFLKKCMILAEYKYKLICFVSLPNVYRSADPETMTPTSVRLDEQEKSREYRNQTTEHIHGHLIQGSLKKKPRQIQTSITRGFSEFPATPVSGEHDYNTQIILLMLRMFAAGSDNLTYSLKAYKMPSRPAT